MSFFFIKNYSILMLAPKVSRDLHIFGYGIIIKSKCGGFTIPYPLIDLSICTINIFYYRVENGKVTDTDNPKSFARLKLYMLSKIAYPIKYSFSISLYLWLVKVSHRPDGR